MFEVCAQEFIVPQSQGTYGTGTGYFGKLPVQQGSASELFSQARLHIEHAAYCVALLCQCTFNLSLPDRMVPSCARTCNPLLVLPLSSIMAVWKTICAGSELCNTIYGSFLSQVNSNSDEPCYL